MNADAAQLAQLERLLRWCTWLLRISSVIALGLVSWGSYSVVRWLQMPIPVAVAYPIVIDMAMLYVTPFAVNAMLPNTDEWPIRRRASRIRAFVWIVVAGFNLLHAWMMVAHLPLTGTMQGVAYGVGGVIGIGPVVFYGYAYAIEAQVAAWVVKRRAEIEKAAEDKQEAEAEADKAAERKTAEKVAVVRARAEAAPAAPREVAPQSREATPAPVAASGRRTPDQQAELDRLPGRTLKDRVAAWVAEQWEAGVEVTAKEAVDALGTDPSDTRKAVRLARENGAVPPSEQRPALAAVRG